MATAAIGRINLNWFVKYTKMTGDYNDIKSIMFIRRKQREVSGPYIAPKIHTIMTK